MTKNAAVTVVRFVNLVFAGVFAGFLVAALVVELTLRNYGLVYVQVRHVELAHLDELASATLLPALVTAVVLTVVAFRTRGRERWLTLTALALLIVVFATTLSVNLPINHDQLHWNAHSRRHRTGRTCGIGGRSRRWRAGRAASSGRVRLHGCERWDMRHRTPPDFAAGTPLAVGALSQVRTAITQRHAGSTRLTLRDSRRRPDRAREIPALPAPRGDDLGGGRARDRTGRTAMNQFQAWPEH